MDEPMALLESKSECNELVECENDMKKRIIKICMLTHTHMSTRKMGNERQEGTIKQLAILFSL